MPLIATVTRSPTGPRDVRFDPPDTWALPRGNQTPLALSQLELRAVLFLWGPVTAAFLTQPFHTLPAQETLPTRHCLSGTLTQLAQRVLCATWSRHQEPEGKENEY